MLRGHKYYDENGVQLAVYFGEIMKITQDVNGGFSHKGTKNMDEAGADSGISPAFAPYDGNYGWKHAPKTGAPTGVVFDSAKKVRTARLGIKYVIAFFWHDDNISDVQVGKFVAQGDHFYDEGTAGHATGNHIHFGVTVSDTPYNGAYPLIENEYGNWEIRNEVNPWDVFFVNDTKILNGMGHNWLKYAAPVAAKSAEEVTNLKVGDRVKIIGTNYATGQLVPSLVKTKVYTIDGIGTGPKGPKCRLKEILSWVYQKDLTKV